MIEVTTDWYLTLAALLFSIGFIGMMVRRNALIMFMCIELMLNAVNLTFITASKHFGTIDAQVAVFFVLVVAAAEVVVGLAIIVSIFKKQETASVDILRSSKGYNGIYSISSCFYPFDGLNIFKFYLYIIK